jgi:putative aldouronate transport system substrate-binding protein
MYLSANTDVIESLLVNEPNAKVSVLDPAYASVDGKPQSRAYWPFGMIMGINSTTTKEQRIAIWMYLEWMSQPDNLFYLQNGVEGRTYTKDQEGIAIAKAGYRGEAKLSANKNKDYWCLVTESAEYDDPELNQKVNLANWAPQGYEYLIEDAYHYYKKYQEYSTPDVLFGVHIQNIAEYKTTLNDLWKKLYVKCVISREDEFDAVYQDACEQYLSSGYEEILQEKQTAIDAGAFK